MIWLATKVLGAVLVLFAVAILIVDRLFTWIVKMDDYD